jgi:hypothetical protein
MAPYKLDPILVDNRYWLFPDGRWLYLIAGGDGDGDGDDGGDGDDDADDDKDKHDDADGDDGQDSDDDPKLGPAGERALAAERKARRDAEKRAKDLQSQLDAKNQQDESEHEKAVREASDAARSEEREKANTRILRAELKARAGTKLADPEDAPNLIDLSKFEVAEDGTVDTDKLDKAVDKLLEKKPYLKSGAKPAGKPTADGGARPPGDKTPDVKSRLERIKEQTGIT